MGGRRCWGISGLRPLGMGDRAAAYPFRRQIRRKLPLPEGLPFRAFRIRMGLGVLGVLWIPAFAGMTGWCRGQPGGLPGAD